MIFCLPQTASSWGDKEPTAIVIDNATGKPVEGAVALAQWFRAGGGTMFEGGVDVLDKAKEAFSDKDGKVEIGGFWGTTILTGKPRLTVYKPGYVLWDSRRICPTLEGRTDFDEKHRTVKLLKFDAEAPRWAKEYPNRSGGQRREMQNSCYHDCYNSESQKFNTQFMDIFRKYELPLIQKEELERREKVKLK